MSKAREEAGRLRYKFLEEIYPDVLLGHRASNYNLELAKECALICVDENIQLLKDLDNYFHEAGHDRTNLEKALEIKLEVKQELNNL